MAREKESYRDNLERLDAAFPNREMLNLTDVSKYTGFSRRVTMERFSFTAKKAGRYYKYFISKAVLARELS